MSPHDDSPERGFSFNDTADMRINFGPGHQAMEADATPPKRMSLATASAVKRMAKRRKALLTMLICRSDHTLTLSRVLGDFALFIARHLR